MAATPAGRFIRAKDGDTVEIAFTVRLAGIKTEDGSELDEKARQRIEELLTPGKARVDVLWYVGETTYRRLTAHVTDRYGNDIGEILVEEGLADRVDPRPMSLEEDTLDPEYVG